MTDWSTHFHSSSICMYIYNSDSPFVTTRHVLSVLVAQNFYFFIFLDVYIFNERKIAQIQ